MITEKFCLYQSMRFRDMKRHNEDKKHSACKLSEYTKLSDYLIWIFKLSYIYIVKICAKNFYIFIESESKYA